MNRLGNSASDTAVSRSVNNRNPPAVNQIRVIFHLSVQSRPIQRNRWEKYYLRRDCITHMITSSHRFKLGSKTDSSPHRGRGGGRHWPNYPQFVSSWNPIILIVVVGLQLSSITGRSQPAPKSGMQTREHRTGRSARRGESTDKPRATVPVAVGIKTNPHSIPGSTSERRMTGEMVPSKSADS